MQTLMIPEKFFSWGMNFDLKEIYHLIQVQSIEGCRPFSANMHTLSVNLPYPVLQIFL